MIYKSCPMIENYAMNFNGRIDTGDKCMTLCCENILEKPGTIFGDTPEQSLENFRRERAELIAESVRLALLDDADIPRNFTRGCDKCANYKLANFNSGDGVIHYVNLSMYPAPCQCKCVYCEVHDGELGAFNKLRHAEYYEKLFDMLYYAKRKGKIASDAVWQISSGEIALHPYKDRIIELVRGQRSCFYTNCFIYDQHVADNLASNPLSSINLSIDSGTPDTWFKVKGVNNFETVTDNLVKYYSSSCPGQITLKYIVLPGVNDNMADYKSIIEIMKVLEVNHLTISRDTRIKYERDDMKENLIGAAGYLAAMLYKNDLKFDLFTYTNSERDLIAKYAGKLIRIGEV